MDLSVIHFISLYESPENPPFSGAENHLWMLLPDLQKHNIHIELGILLQSDGPRIQNKLSELRDAGIITHCFPFRSSPRRSAFCYRMFDPACTAHIARFLRDKRHWLIHTHLDQADINGKIAARLVGCRHVLSTVHNNEPDHLHWKWRWVTRLLEKWTSHYIAISDAVRRHLVESQHLPARKVTVIPYGVPTPDQQLTKSEIRQKLGLAANKFIIGYVGRLTPQKNLGLLIDAMHMLPDDHCVLIGTGELSSALQSQARSMPNIQFLGHQPNAADLMPAFDVFCLPSLWEGLGLVLVEAMLRGVPVVGSTAGAIPEVLDHGRAGVIFDPTDVHTLVQAINASKRLGPSLSAVALQHAQNKYSLSRMTNQTLDLYRTIPRSNT